MTAKYKKLLLAPYYFLVPSVDKMVFISILLLIPQIIMLFISKSTSSLILIATIVLASLLVDFVVTFFLDKSYKISWIPIFQGILIGFFIPSGYPLLLAFFVTILALFISKYAFGGFAQAWANPVVVTIIIMYFLGSNYFPSFLLNPDFLQNSNAGAELFNRGLLQSGSYDSNISTVLNNTVFSKLGISVPVGYITLFWDSGSIIPAFRFNILTIVASLFLLVINIIDEIIPAVFLLVYSFLVYYFGIFPYGGQFGGGDVLLALLTSGTLFATFFIFEWYGTYPQSLLGKIMYGLIIGITAFLITGCGTSPVGIIFTALVANVFSPLIQHVEQSIYFFHTKKHFENKMEVNLK